MLKKASTWEFIPKWQFLRKKLSERNFLFKLRGDRKWWGFNSIEATWYVLVKVWIGGTRKKHSSEHSSSKYQKMLIVWQSTKLPANKPESIFVLLQQTDKMVFVIKMDKAKVSHWISPHKRKKQTSKHLIPAEYLEEPNNGYEHRMWVM